MNEERENLPETIGDLCDYISLWKHSIYVREQVNGKWDSYALTELPSNKAIDHTLHFVKEGRIPVRLKEVK